MSEYNDMIYLGGLWKQTSGAGRDYLSGKFGIGGRLLVFANTNKDNPNAPDYHLYIVPAARKDDAPDDSGKEIPF